MHSCYKLVLIAGGRTFNRCVQGHEMDVSEADPYKQQLQALFESFDTNNVGSLDHRGLQQLCEQLPLDQNQSAELVNFILQDASAGISFAQFWDGLLTLLGGERTPTASEGSATAIAGDKDENLSRGESPGR